MANERIGNYAPDEFTIVLSQGDFVHTVGGFADGTFITMDRLVPTSEPYIGAGKKGAFGRVKRSITALQVNITLNQYSATNDLFQALQLADARDVTSNEWVFACTIRDMSGRTTMSTSEAIIIAPPTVTFGTSTETRDWGIYMYGSDLFIGGNSKLTADEVAAIEATGGSVDSRWILQ